MTATHEFEVSVVLCVLNGAKTIRRQLDSLNAQVDAPKFEVIIADNGSADGTREIVQDWIATATAPTQARLVDAGERRGIMFARNYGSRFAQGRLLAFCDADDRVHPGWVAALSESVVSGIAGGSVHAFLPSGEPAPDTFPDGLQQTSYLPMVGGCNLCVVREDFFAVGGFDESLPPYGCEDLDLSWPMQEQGFPITYVPDAGVDFTLTPPTRVVRKEYRLAKARMAVAAHHPRSTPQPTLKVVSHDLITQALMLPVRLVRPQPVTRSRRIRWAVDAVGRAAGYWRYFVRTKPVQLLPQEQS